MRAFLASAAVLTGLANAVWYALFADNTFDDLLEAPSFAPWPLFLLYALSGVLAGLLISSVLLKL